MPIELDADTWDRISGGLSTPWPRAAAWTDLLLEAEAGRRSGRPALAARWGWSGWKVRSLLAEFDRRQPAASPPPAEAQGFQAVSRQDRQPAASPPPAAAAAAIEPPARRQPAASPPPAEAQGFQVVSRQDRQPAASPPPETGSSPELRPMEVEGEREPELPDLDPDPERAAQDLPPMTGEARLFLRVVQRFAVGSSEVKPTWGWRLDLARDLGWFVGRVEGEEDYRDLDVRAELERWESWLEVQARAKMAARRTRFPSNWKANLTNWLKRATKSATTPTHQRTLGLKQPNTGGHDGTRTTGRGAYGGRRSRGLPVQRVSGGSDT